MQKPIHKSTPVFASKVADDHVEKYLIARLHNSVQASRNDRVRLAQRIGTVIRQVLISYLDDEQRTMSAAFANGVPQSGFDQRHNKARKLMDELDELDPTLNAGLGLLGEIASVLEEYVGWEEHVLYPSIEQMLHAKGMRKSADMTALMAAELGLPMVDGGMTVPGTSPA